MVRAGLDPDQTINNQSSVALAESGLAIEYIGPAAKQQTKSSGYKKVMADRTFFFFRLRFYLINIEKAQLP